MKILAIDIGGMSIKYTIFKNDKEIFKPKNVSLRTNSESGLSNKEDAIKVINEIISKYKLDIDGIGISSPGAMLKNGYINGPTGIIGYQHFNIKDTIIKENNLNIPITVLNDANAAAFADYKTIEANSTIATLAVGTGIGGGIIVEGNMIFGSKGFAGELGMMSVFTHENSDILKPTFGSPASGFYHLEKYYEEIAGNKLEGKKIFELYEQKDKYAVSAIDRFYSGLAIIVFNTYVTLDTDVIFLAGGLSKRKTASKELSQYVNKIGRAFDFKENFIKIRNSKFSGSGQLIGAYKYCLENIK